MDKTWVAVIAFAAGVGAGLLVAKLYARAQVGDAVDSALEKVGLGGGVVQSFADKYIVPAVV